jgi:DNA mismatch repair protein MutH
MIASPRDEHELRIRAFGLEGRTIASLAASIGMRLPTIGVRSKGKVGELLERALGATGGSRAAHDFPDLRIELKTLPIDLRGVARESTYVCRAPLHTPELLEWRTSWVRAKLSHVLFVPVITADARAPWTERKIARPFFWEPSAEIDAALGRDFDEIVGLAATRGITAVSARVGTHLQLRPKAANASVTSESWIVGAGNDGLERETSGPRGFYLRASFTTSIASSFS